MATSDGDFINGLLCFISTARHTYSEVTLISLCLSFYNSDKINAAKKELFNVANEQLIARRGDGKARADVTDILNLFGKCEQNKVQLPRFLADAFDSMPPVSGYEVLAEHIVELLVQVGELKGQVRALNETAANLDTSSVIEIKEDLHDIKKLLMSTSFGALPTLMPGGSITSSYSSVLAANDSLPKLTRRNQNDNSSPSNTGNLPSDAKRNPTVNGRVSVVGDIRGVVNHNQKGSDKVISPITGISSVLPNTEKSTTFLHASDTLPRKSKKHATQGAGSVSEDCGGNLPPDRDAHANDHSQWQVINRKLGKRNAIRGCRTEVNAIKGVKNTMDIYIGRLDKSVSDKDLTGYISNDLGIGVISCICLSRIDSDVKSFKVTVNSENRDKLLDGNLWPENVHVRKYFSSRRNGRNNN